MCFSFSVPLLTKQKEEERMDMITGETNACAASVDDGECRHGTKIIIKAKRV